jgi:carbonic anhydrase
MLFPVYRVSAITVFFSVASAACNYGTSAFPRLPQVAVSKFTYTGLTGPLNWYGLDKTANGMCAKGTNQSPINIDTSKITIDKGSTLSLDIPAYPEGAVFENLGTNVEVVVNGTLVDGGKTYSLAQFHFHTTSEHRVNDEYSLMEVHFVFEAAGMMPLPKHALLLPLKYANLSPKISRSQSLLSSSNLDSRILSWPLSSLRFPKSPLQEMRP